MLERMKKATDVFAWIICVKCPIICVKCPIICVKCPIICVKCPIPVAAWSKAPVCRCALARIVGSKPAGGVDDCFL